MLWRPRQQSTWTEGSWEDGDPACEPCLRPNETDAPFVTPAALELRAPAFHTKSLLAWKQYEPWLAADLFPHLDDAA